VLALISLAAVQLSKVAPPISWALNFVSPPGIPLVGDINNDGYADMICVYPQGDCSINVSINVEGMKPGQPYQSNANWGKDCQGAISGQFDDQPGADVVGLFGGQTLRLAHAFSGGHYADEPDWIKLPKMVDQPNIALDSDGKTILVWSGSHGYAVDSGTKLVKERTSGFPLVPRVKPEDSIYLRGDVDHDGDADIFEFRRKSEHFAGYDVLLHRTLSDGETDSDHDGLTNDEEAKLGTDPYNPDTDGDGLLDGWETGTFRDLDLKGMGCSPIHVDLICLTSRFSNADPAMVKRTMDRVKGYYASLNAKNPDGTIGWNLHTVDLPPVGDDDQKHSWWDLRDKFLPTKWKGVVHWMQLTPWGGGQSDQLGDGGGCGGYDDTLYATFIHEFGHQLGLSHEGFYRDAWCPTFPSLMNYAYSYDYEDSIKNVHYSDGALAGYLLHETDLDETIPLPIEKVKFLSMSPYRYRLKAAGNNTLIDWNWDGIFGQKHVRADINYSYSTSAGPREQVDKTDSAPWVFVHKNDAYLLFAKHSYPADPKTDPSIGPDKPGALLLRRLIKPGKWTDAQTIESGGVTGDPVATSYGGQIVAAYQTKTGVVVRRVQDHGDVLSMDAPTLVDADSTHIPSLCVYHDRLYLFLTNPNDHSVSYRSLTGRGAFNEPKAAPFTSVEPVGTAVDAANDQLVVGLTQDQGKDKSSRWQIRRFTADSDRLNQVSMEWIEGEKGNDRGSSRPVVVYDPDPRELKGGRVYFFALGTTSAANPWSCVYCARQIGDKTMNDGWQTVRFYDEWTQSRSAPGACWFRGEILYAYRWADGGQGASDNILHVGYRGTGIETDPMGDFDEIGYMHSFGIAHAIPYLANPG
jgi:hypothetical protein